MSGDVGFQMAEMRDVISCILPRLHVILYKKKCLGCNIGHPSQDQHICITDDNKEFGTSLVNECLNNITDQMVRAVYVASSKNIPSVTVDNVMTAYGSVIRDKFNNNVPLNVVTEAMVDHFYNMTSLLFVSTPTV